MKCNFRLRTTSPKWSRGFFQFFLLFLGLLHFFQLRAPFPSFLLVCRYCRAQFLKTLASPKFPSHRFYGSFLSFFLGSFFPLLSKVRQLPFRPPLRFVHFLLLKLSHSGRFHFMVLMQCDPNSVTPQACDLLTFLPDYPPAPSFRPRPPLSGST